MSDPLVRDVSDTARWVAWYRAYETERPDALFKDPFAKALAGERGARIAAAMQTREGTEWVFTARTVLFDRMISDAINAGADTILNLAAGLDARPYRLNLPPELRWIEVDMPHMIDFKEQHLRGAEPRCRLERVKLDLENVAERNAFFDRVARESNYTMIVTEGLLPYFSPGAVDSLARDLGKYDSFRLWVTDMMSPRIVQMIGKRFSKHLAAAPFKFAPANGVAFFEPAGWHAKEVASFLKTAADLKRVPWMMRFFAKIPINAKKPGRQPWSAAVLLEKNSAA